MRKKSAIPGRMERISRSNLGTKRWKELWDWWRNLKRDGQEERDWDGKHRGKGLGKWGLNENSLLNRKDPMTSFRGGRWCNMHWSCLHLWLVVGHFLPQSVSCKLAWSLLYTKGTTSSRHGAIGRVSKTSGSSALCGDSFGLCCLCFFLRQHYSQIYYGGRIIEHIVKYKYGKCALSLFSLPVLILKRVSLLCDDYLRNLIIDGCISGSARGTRATPFFHTRKWALRSESVVFDGRECCQSQVICLNELL